MKKYVVTRRELLRSGTAASVSLLCLPATKWALSQPRESAPAVRDVDHLILGVPDLDEGMRFFEQRSGVKPIVGGVHPGKGTWNALVSLGERKYLEILAPDPIQIVQHERAAFLKSLNRPKIIGWVAGTREIESIAKRVQAKGIGSSGLVAGSREKPDGTVLHWRTLAVEGHDRTVVPFVIEWGDGTVHPSEDSPEGCHLQELHLEHPDADEMNPFLETMGLAARVTKGPKPKLSPLLETPKGVIEL